MRKATKALWMFLGIIAIMVGSLLLFIQSRTFASILKDTAHKYMPTDFGVSGNFSELAVKLIPPGVVIKNPAIVLKEKNPAGLPAGTKLDAQFIDVTFQFFQLLTGSITINAFAVHGATLKLDLDERFFAAREQQAQKVKSIGSKFSWDNLVRFNFRSVSLIDSQVDIRISRGEGGLPLHVESFAKELTIGRSTIDGFPSYDLAVDLQKAMVELGGFRHTIGQLQASVELSANGASIPNFGIQEGELNVHANGQIHGNLLKPRSLKTDLSYIVRGPLPAWLDPSLAGHFIKLPKNTPVDGLITVDGRLVADLMEFERTVETKATIQLENATYSGWHATKVVAKGAWKAPLLSLDSADVELADGGKIHSDKVVFDAHDRSQAVRLNLKLEGADFRKLLGPEVRSVFPIHMMLSGDVAAEITTGDDFGIDGTADLNIRQFSFDNQKPDVARPLRVLFAVPELTLKAHYSLDSDGFEFDQTEVILPRSKLHAAGKVDSKNGFDIDARGHVDLSDLGRLSAFDITGEGDLHWTIKGRRPFIAFGFDAELENARYLDLDLGKVKGRVVYNDGDDTLYFQNLEAVQGRSQFIANGTINVGASDDANMTVQVPKGTVQDFATVFDSFLKKAVPWYPYSLLGQMSGVIKVSGKTPLDKLSVEGDMELANVDFHHEIFRSARVHGGYRRGAYIAENVVVRKKNGLLRGNLVFGADDVMRFDLRSEGLSTLDIDHLASFGIPYRAPISLDTQGSGKYGALKSVFHLTFGEGIVKNYPVPRTDFGFNTENGRLRGDLSVFAGQVKGHVDMGWEKGASSVLDIDARNFNFEPLLIGLNPDLSEDPELQAAVSGAAHLKFQMGALSRLSGMAGIDSYVLRRRGYSLGLVAPVSTDIVNGSYQFNGLKFAGSGTALSVDGRVRDGRIDYNANGTLNLGVFEFLVPQLASIRGSAQISSNVYGLADEPHFKARVGASGFDLRIRAIEQPFEDTHFTVDWADELIRVNDVGAKFAGGAVKGEGTARLYAYKVPDFNFRLDIQNSRMKVYPVAYARASGKLSLTGNELPYKVKGSLAVAEALINENFNPAESARTLRSSKFLPQKNGGAAGELQIFDLDVDIAADRGIYVRNDLFDCEVKGSIKVVNTLEAPRVLGQATVLHGRLLFKDNFFLIQSGNLAFKNPAAIDPEFDLAAQTEVKGYKVNLVANGQASAPNLNFQSQPPLSQHDIVNLLTLGVTSTGYQNIARENRDAYSRNELYDLLFMQSGVNKGLQQKLGVKLRVDQSQLNVPESAFRPKSAADLTETVAPKVVLQKEVTKNFNASVGSTVGVGDNQERNIDLEYNMTKHWSILGTYEDQRGTLPSQSRTSVGADLKYKLRF